MWDFPLLLTHPTAELLLLLQWVSSSLPVWGITDLTPWCRLQWRGTCVAVLSRNSDCPVSLCGLHRGGGLGFQTGSQLSRTGLEGAHCPSTTTEPEHCCFAPWRGVNLRHWGGGPRTSERGIPLWGIPAPLALRPQQMMEIGPEITGEQKLTIISSSYHLLSTGQACHTDQTLY